MFYPQHLEAIGAVGVALVLACRKFVDTLVRRSTRPLSIRQGAVLRGAQREQTRAPASYVSAYIDVIELYF